MSSNEDLAQDSEHVVQRWSLIEWDRVFKWRTPTMRHVIECLGLPEAKKVTNSGTPTFVYFIHKKLSEEVKKLSKGLTNDAWELLEFAANPNSLDQELENLLADYGPEIWGRHADRSRLLSPDPIEKPYIKDLFYEEDKHREILKILLHRWILIRTHGSIASKRAREIRRINRENRQSDIHGDKCLAHRTPQSPGLLGAETVPGVDLDIEPTITEKHKRGADPTMSDDDNLEAPPAKRPYSTLPPPLKNDLKDGSRPLAVTKDFANFAHRSATAANTGSFTAVNNTPSASELPREPIREPKWQPSREVHWPPPAQQQPSQTRPQDSRQMPSHTPHQGPVSTYLQFPQLNHLHPTHIQTQQQHLPRSSRETNVPVHSRRTSHVRIVPCESALPPDCQASSAPAIRSAPDYGTRLIPTQEAHTIPSSRKQRPSIPSQSATSQHASAHQPVPEVHQHQSEAAYVLQPPQTFSRGSVSTADLRSFQREITAELLEFFYPRSTVSPDESALLVRMRTLWSHGEAPFRAELPQHFDLVSEILTVWLDERQVIASLRHSMQVKHGFLHGKVVDHMVTMNNLRDTRLKWKNMSLTDGLSFEDMLCMAFKVMTNTGGSENVFKYGLARLELGI
ncbi:hypothetical protein AA0119_g13509 [Alternaria tenuissima]|uniref:Clr5 domain-containing protein n=1 Tax=Alternaria tenuissima TaxID=119927 RepID=A0ABY0FRI2_9PLEO|nr:hypothetical protein AA0119_g13509 [Alternaria tenuissima]RYN98521.1 hypothetical protein AA0121_g13504 [Alternaria tenuissima]